jgi:hypothetical protein
MRFLAKRGVGEWVSGKNFGFRVATSKTETKWRQFLLGLPFGVIHVTDQFEQGPSCATSQNKDNVFWRCMFSFFCRDAWEGASPSHMPRSYNFLLFHRIRRGPLTSRKKFLRLFFQDILLNRSIYHGHLSPCHPRHATHAQTAVSNPTT